MLKKMQKLVFSLSLVPILSLYCVIAQAEWSDPVNVSNTKTYSQHPNIALKGKDKPHIVWCEDSQLIREEGESAQDFRRRKQDRKFKREVFYAKKDEAGNWRLKNVSQTEDRDSRYAHIVIDEEGTIHVIWFEVRKHWKNMCHRYKKNGKKWSKKKYVATSSKSFFPIMATTGRKVHLVWEERLGKGLSEIYYAKYRYGTSTEGEWTKPKQISDLGGKSEHPFVATDGQGKVHVVWSCQEDIYYTTNREGTWSEPENITSDAFGNSRLSIIDYADNKIFVVWEEEFPNYSDVLFKERDVDGIWGNKFNVSDSGAIFSRTPFLSVDKENTDVHVVWTEQDPPNRIYYRVRLNSVWLEPDCVACENQNTKHARPVVAVGKNGVHVVYREYIPEDVEYDIFYTFKAK